MSASYAWKPATPVDPFGRIQLGLVDAIAERIGGFEDASRDLLNDAEMDKDWVPWLEGIKVGASPDSDMHDDAQSLIQAIHEYGAIRFEVIR